MKTLNIAAGSNNSWFISLQVKKGDATKKINVSLNRSEFATLQVIAKVNCPSSYIQNTHGIISASLACVCKTPTIMSKSTLISVCDIPMTAIRGKRYRLSIPDKDEYAAMLICLGAFWG